MKREFTRTSLEYSTNDFIASNNTHNTIINPETQNVVGILTQGFPAHSLSPEEIMFELDKEEHIEGTPKLTTREKQVIFLFLANYTSQDIAQKIGQFEGKKISKSTIDGVFNDRLYLKFDVHSRSKLREKLLSLGLASRIPKELLSIRSIDLNNIKTY